MSRIHANNFSTTLNGAITNVATSIVLTSVSNFPAIGSGVECHVTITDGTNIEIVKATSRSSFTLTVTRGAEGTTGTAFASGSTVEIRPTADSVDRKLDTSDTTTNLVTASTTGTTKLIAGGNSTAAGYIELLEDTDNGSNKLTITGQQSMASDKTVTFQDVTGTVYVSGGTDVPVTDGGTGLSATTAYAVLCGGTTSTAALQSIASVGTSGQALISGGAGALPAFGTLNVANGGSGRTSATAYAVICGGTTSTGAEQSIASVGTSGQVLTSNGAGALPTFQTPAGGGGGGLVFISTQTASASSSLSFTSGLSSTYTTYMIIIQGLYTSATTTIKMTCSNDGGSTYFNSYYDVCLTKISSDAGTQAITVATNAADWDLSAGVNTQNSIATTTNGTIYLSNLNAGNGNYADARFDISTSKSGGYGSWTQGVGKVQLTSASAVNAIKFAPTSGTFTAGTITLYGLALS
jgi:hypothetical protein